MPSGDHLPFVDELDTTIGAGPTPFGKRSSGS